MYDKHDIVYNFKHHMHSLISNYAYGHMCLIFLNSFTSMVSKTYMYMLSITMD